MTIHSPVSVHANNYAERNQLPSFICWHVSSYADVDPFGYGNNMLTTPALNGSSLCHSGVTLLSATIY
jgi:hypothetical protein